MRDKRRYILVESGIGVAEAERDDFSLALYNALLHSIGESTYHRVNPRMVKFVSDRRFVLRAGLAGSGLLIAALGLLKKMNGKDCYFYTLKTSGTIKALSSFKY